MITELAVAWAGMSQLVSLTQTLALSLTPTLALTLTLTLTLTQSLALALTVTHHKGSYIDYGRSGGCVGRNELGASDDTLVILTLALTLTLSLTFPCP